MLVIDIRVNIFFFPPENSCKKLNALVKPQKRVFFCDPATKRDGGKGKALVAGPQKRPFCGFPYRTSSKRTKKMLTIKKILKSSFEPTEYPDF